MVHADPLRAEWRGRNALRPIYRSMTMTEDGLVLGAGTMLALMEDLLARRGGLALAGDRERLLALLAAFYGQPVEPEVLANIRRSAQYLRDGERCLASIALALTRLPPVADEDEACWGLYVADRLIADGAAPRDALEAMASTRLQSTRSRPTSTILNRGCPRVTAGRAADGPTAMA